MSDPLPSPLHDDGAHAVLVTVREKRRIRARIRINNMG